MQIAVAAAGLWTAPDAVREVDALALTTPTDLAAWAAAQGPAERRELWGRLDTQVLLGDTVLVDDVKDGWAQVVVPSQPCRKDPRGYPGWLPLSQLAAPAEETGEQVVVTVPKTDIRVTPGGEVLIADVSFATILPVQETSADWVRVNLPGGGTGYLPRADVSAYPSENLPTAEQLLTTGRQFLGLMYLAGGVTAHGLDCSGLTYGLYRRFGQVIPRDATDQYAVGERIDLADLAPGDLMFFRKPDTGFVYHVGLCAEVVDGWPSMLHCSQTDWDTLDGPITEVRHEHLFAARRLVG
ncbi:NlpC/P60 family protein [Hamadaea sp.]|uniref:C40 family peptidase n=1 Tax=Hamadaea sp. TaxID=2024425 RepID=UPI0025C64F94|nr:NlpC/P60 family protein [Hamadaea sp.]